jgi:hypothetical protein
MEEQLMNISEQFLRYPFGAPESREPQPLPQTEEEIHETLDYGAIEKDVFLLKAFLLNND